MFLIYHLLLFLSLSVSLKVIQSPSTASSLPQQDHGEPAVKPRKNSFLNLERCEMSLLNKFSRLAALNFLLHPIGPYTASCTLQRSQRPY